jgi:hypothetical protein
MSSHAQCKVWCSAGYRFDEACTAARKTTYISIVSTEYGPERIIGVQIFITVCLIEDYGTTSRVLENHGQFEQNSRIL